MERKRHTQREPGIIVVYAEDKNGLLGQILVHFNRKGFDVKSLNVARMDISNLVMITIEAYVPAEELNFLLRKIEKIVEVYWAKGFAPGEIILDKIGVYQFSPAIIGPYFQALCQKYGALISYIGDDMLIVRKTGNDADLLEFYEKLEGPHLLGFFKSCLLAEPALSPADVYEIHAGV